MNWDIDLIFGMRVYNHKLQINFEIPSSWMTPEFTWYFDPGFNFPYGILTQGSIFCHCILNPFMVNWTPPSFLPKERSYPWYFDPPAHGISTPLPMIYHTLSYGIMNSSLLVEMRGGFNLPWVRFHSVKNANTQLNWSSATSQWFIAFTLLSNFKAFLIYGCWWFWQVPVSYGILSPMVFYAMKTNKNVCIVRSECTHYAYILLCKQTFQIQSVLVQSCT
jgi:hypothetical protein